MCVNKVQTNIYIEILRQLLLFSIIMRQIGALEQSTDAYCGLKN